MRKIAFFLTVFFLSACHFPILAASVVINEVLPHPFSDNDWVELYKTVNEEVNIGGWQLEDSTGVFETFPEDKKVASSSSFLLVYKYKRLNNGGDLIRLKDKDGTVLDEKTYNQDPGVDISLGRYPDGANSWGVLTVSSPNDSNSNFAPIPTSIPTNLHSPTPTHKPTSTPKPSSVPKPSSTPKPQSKVTADTTVVPTNTILTSKSLDKSLDKSEQVTSSGNQNEEVLGEFASGGTVISGENEVKKVNNKANNSILTILLAGGLISFLTAAVISFRRIKEQSQRQP